MRKLLIAATAALAVGLSGCGGQGGSPSQSQPAVQTAIQATVEAGVAATAAAVPAQLQQTQDAVFETINSGLGD